VRDRATVEHPDRMSEGISWVIVGGQVALDSRGPRRNVRAGKPIRAEVTSAR
jgi:dihydroorotase